MRDLQPGARNSIARQKHRKFYANYMRSGKWFARRKKWFEEEKQKLGVNQIFCLAGCGNEWGLNDDLHHITYDRLGNEDHEDLWAMCRTCHKLLHKIIEQKSWRKLPYKHANFNGLKILQKIVNK